MCIKTTGHLMFLRTRLLSHTFWLPTGITGGMWVLVYFSVKCVTLLVSDLSHSCS